MTSKNLNTFFFFPLSLSCVSWQMDKGEKEALEKCNAKTQCQAQIESKNW